MGGRIEWSVRPIAANRVIGMWQADALVARAAGRVMAVRGRIVDLLLVARQARLVAASSPSNRIRPLGVWQWLQSSLPDLSAGAHQPGGVGVVFAQVAAVGVDSRRWSSMTRSKWSKNLSPGWKSSDSGTILAWQVAHMSFICCGGELLGADDLDVLRELCPLARPACHHADVLARPGRGTTRN